MQYFSATGMGSDGRGKWREWEVADVAMRAGAGSGGRGDARGKRIAAPLGYAVK